MVIEKSSALKAFYYLLYLDGMSISVERKFDEIGQELIGNEYLTVKHQIIEDCRKQIALTTIYEDPYDLIVEGLDIALSNKVKKVADGIVPRLIVWDMLCLANSDEKYSESENRLIAHVARILNVEKSVFLEMKQLISTAISTQKEREMLEMSNRPYNEIRPLVEEIEKRNSVVLDSARALIADEIILDEPDDEENESALVSTGKKIGETVVSGSKKIGTTVVTGSKKLGETVAPVAQDLGKKAVKGASNLAEGAGKFFGKLKDKANNKKNGGVK